MNGQTALVVGAGDVALRRTKTLLASGAQVRVIAPQILTAFDQLDIQIERRSFQAGDTQGAFLVVAATDNSHVNDQIALEAKQAGKLINHAGCAEQSTLRFPAVVEQHDVQVAINTGRELPLLSKALCQRVSTFLPAEQELSEWTVQRQAALKLVGTAKQEALNDLRSKIQQTVEASV